jgi:hypothetical protein
MDRPSAATRQSSFARSFFQSAGEQVGVLDVTSSASIDSNTNEGSPGFPVPRSRPVSRLSYRRGSSSNSKNSMTMNMAAAAAAVFRGDSSDDNSDDGPANSSWYADAHQRVRNEVNLNEILTDSGEQPEEDLSGFGDVEVLEQYKIMALHEARVRVKANIGFDIQEKESENKATGPTDKRSMYGGIKKPNVRLPEPKRLPPKTCKELQPEEPPLLPPRPSTKLVQQKSKRVPELMPGATARGGGLQSISPGEHMVRCLGCRSNLRVDQKATLVRCCAENCNVISPASSTRR